MKNTKKKRLGQSHLITSLQPLVTTGHTMSWNNLTLCSCNNFTNCKALVQPLSLFILLRILGQDYIIPFKIISEQAIHSPSSKLRRHRWVFNKNKRENSVKIGDNLPIMYLEKAMTSHSSILVWRTPWTEEPGGLQSRGSHSRTRLTINTFTYNR